ncbi:snapin/pallidin family protein [Candidatus Absconditicoccus praedator]|uniref:snapin/pallidin family protein n=1 Tax=Candidatus Absconditicoccus praedator TaxID=2735562 RepID=UPI001E3A835D|nr:snapin/pallidin family protein [Candidatus Absconditicoccus praedator]UFX82735.1 hypothetical protein HLG78_01115 [Candidatus Absconditicoccus praedator]
MKLKTFILAVLFFFVSSSLWAYEGETPDSMPADMEADIEVMSLTPQANYKAWVVGEATSEQEVVEKVNNLVEQINDISPKLAETLQSADRLLSRPDGPSFGELQEALGKMEAQLADFNQSASMSDEAREKLREIRQEMGSLEDRMNASVARLEGYSFGLQAATSSIQLDGEGKGSFDVEFTNGQEVEACYAVGKNLKATPTVRDFEVFAVAPMPSYEGNDMVLYGYGVGVEGDSMVDVKWYPHPYTERAAEWHATYNHNIPKDRRDFVMDCDPEDD